MLNKMIKISKSCCNAVAVYVFGRNSGNSGSGFFKFSILLLFFLMSFGCSAQSTLTGQVQFSPIQCTGGFTDVIFSANGGVPPYSYSLDGINFSSDNVFSNCNAGQYAQLKIRDMALNEISLPVIQIPDGTAPFITVWLDADGDGYGNSALSQQVCNVVPAGYVLLNGDCNDQDLLISPVSAELCNQVDDDCDGIIDNTLTQAAYFPDADGDGYGSGTGVLLCYDPGFGFSQIGNDCDDFNDQINPGQSEVCNNIDDDCNGNADDGLLFAVYYIDSDLDGFGSTSTVTYCEDPGVGFTTSNQDCDDTDPFINPSATEICNEVDDNCNGLIDTYDPLLSPAGPLQLSLSADPVLCHNGVTDILTAVSGGVEPYDFMDQVLTDVTAGTYTVYVNDANGCMVNAVITINQPAVLQVLTVTPPVSCYGGQTICNVSGSGGTPPYNGTGNFLRFAGNQVFSITDANGCSASSSVFVQQPDSLVVQISSNNIACYGEAATVTITATGGVAPFIGIGQFLQNAGVTVYSITDANGCVSSGSLSLSQPDPLNIQFNYTPITTTGGSTIVSVQASGGVPPYSGIGMFSQQSGAVSYTVADFNGCSTSETLTLSEPGALFATVSEGVISCFGDSAEIVVTASGGLPPYSNTGTFIRPAGPYSIVVTDAAGVTFTVTGNLIQPNPLQLSSVVSPITCIGDSGQIIVAASGGVSPYSGTGSFVKPAGAWNFNVMDANGCPASVIVQLTNPPQPEIAVNIIQPIECFGDSADVLISPVNASDLFIGTGLYSMPAGQNTVYLIDENGCEFSESITLSQPDSLGLISNVMPVQCFGQSQGSVQLQANGGTPPFNYQWNDGQVVSIRSGLAAGVYSVTVTDANNCFVVRQFDITQPVQLPALGGFNGTLQSCKPYGAGVETISVNPISDGLNTTSYNWSIPSGLSIVSGQGTPQITIGWTAAALDATISGTIQLQAFNICESRSASAALSYALVPPVTPGSISGNARLCPGDTFICSVANVARASAYNWVLPPGLQVLSGLSTNVISGLVQPSFQGGTITLSASNVCGTGGLRTRIVSLRPSPTPAVITGLSSGLCGVSVASYSVAPLVGVSGYQWNVPAGSQIVSGQGTPQINVAWNNNSGAVSVSSFNTCGSSSDRTLTVSMIPARPGIITGPVAPCFNTSQSFTIATVPGSTSYQWLATGNPQLTGQGSKSIAALWSTGVNVTQFLSVRAVNACGLSNTRSANVVLSNCNRIADLNVESVLEVRPNPASQFINLTWNGTRNQQMELLAYDANGKLLVKENIASVSGANNFEMSISNFPTGIYRLVLVGEGSFYSAGFLKVSE